MSGRSEPPGNAGIERSIVTAQVGRDLYEGGPFRPTHGGATLGQQVGARNGSQRRRSLRRAQNHPKDPFDVTVHAVEKAHHVLVVSPPVWQPQLHLVVQFRDIVRRTYQSSED